MRVIATALHPAVRLRKLAQPRRPSGVHALALTPEGRLVLVKLRYAPGWRLPGGGRARDEEPRDAILRELREEIGLLSHGRVREAGEPQADGTGSLFIVEDVGYRPARWSWEIERVSEASLDALPSGMSPRARRWIEAARPAI